MLQIPTLLGGSTALAPPRPRALRGTELAAATACLLADEAGHVAAEYQCRETLAYLTRENVAWRGLVQGDASHPEALALLVAAPGGTGLLMLPPHTLPSLEPLAQELLAAQLLAEAPRLGALNYIQTLMHPDDAGGQRVMGAIGMKQLATLEYLQRSVTPPRDAWLPELQWTAYSAASHVRFTSVLERSYANSLDCPELNGRRPIDDVVRAHQACGEFNPLLWQLATLNGADVGCVIAATHAGKRLGEVVYLGVVAEARQQRVGAALLRRAAVLLHARRVALISVAVDKRNTPARKMYGRGGFAAFAERDVYWRLPPSGFAYAASSRGACEGSAPRCVSALERDALGTSCG